MTTPELRFVGATMNSGKSLALLTKNYSYIEQKKKTLLFTSEKDTRNGEYSSTDIIGIISTRIGLSAEAYLLERVNSFELARKEKPDIIFVDEVQFFSEAIIEQLAMIVDRLNIPVTCFGLVTDFQLNFFEGSQAILRLADVKEEIEIECHYCNHKATVNMRIEDDKPVFDGAQLGVGGNESYLAVCRACYMKEKEKSLLKIIV